jgi:hypothetical protein
MALFVTAKPEITCIGYIPVERTEEWKKDGEN